MSTIKNLGLILGDSIEMISWHFNLKFSEPMNIIVEPNFKHGP